MLQFNPAISLVRVLSMMLIVVTHFLSWRGTNSFQLSTIGVSSFLLISGYLYGIKNINQSSMWIKQRINRVLLPFWILALFLSGYLIFTGNYLFAFKQFFESMLNLQGLHSIIRLPFSIGSNHLTGLGHCWFLTIIMLCYLLVVLLKNSRLEFYIDNNLKKSFAFLCVLHLVLSFFNIAIGCFSIFFIGYFFRRWHEKYNYSFIKKFLPLTLFLLGAVAIRLILRVYIDGSNVYDFFVASFSSNLCAIWGFIIVDRLVCKRGETFFSSRIWKKIDEMSFYIYLTHYMFLKEPFSLSTLPLHVKGLLGEIVLFLLLTILSAFILKFVYAFLLNNFFKTKC